MCYKVYSECTYVLVKIVDTILLWWVLLGERTPLFSMLHNNMHETTGSMKYLPKENHESIGIGRHAGDSWTL